MNESQADQSISCLQVPLWNGQAEERPHRRQHDPREDPGRQEAHEGHHGQEQEQRGAVLAAEEEE